MKKIILLLACLLVLMPLVSAISPLYQENANSSVCSGASWGVTGSGGCPDTYDGIWAPTGSGGYSYCVWPATDCYVYFNYTKPAFNYTKYYWNISYGSDPKPPIPESRLVLLPAECVANSNISLSVQSNATVGNSHVVWRCLNSSSTWNVVYDYYTGSSNSRHVIEEQLIYYDGYSISIQSPENKTYLTNSLTLNWSTDTTLSTALYSLDGGANISLLDACYQETATTATSCGGKSTGSYLVDGDYIYTNYTVPHDTYNAIFNVKHGGTIKNITINNTNCFNSNTLQFRGYASFNAPACTASSYTQCYNGTDWQQITPTISQTGCAGFSISADSTSRAYDGDWSTGIGRAENGAWYKCDDVGCIAGELTEESISWNISSNRTIQGLTNGHHNVTVYGTDSFGNTNSSKVYFTTAGVYNIYAYNETDFTTPVNSNITITNGTTTLTFNNVNYTTFDTTQITGILNITAIGANGLFETKQFQDTFSFGENKTHIFYLPETSAVTYEALNAKDYAGFPIDGATITTSKRNGLIYTEIDSQVTDISGTIVVPKVPGTSYKTSVTKTGYIPTTRYDTATLASYDYTMYPLDIATNITADYIGVQVTLTPTNTVLSQSNNNTLNASVYSNSTLAYWTMNVYHNGVLNSSFTDSTNLYGSWHNVSYIAGTPPNGTVTVQIKVKLTNLPERQMINTTYTVWVITDSQFSMKNIFGGLSNQNYGNFSPLVIGIIALIVTIMIMAAIGFEYSATIIIGAIVLGALVTVFTGSIITTGIYVITLMAVMAYLFIKRSI